MGLFGFGKKNRETEEDFEELQENSEIATSEDGEKPDVESEEFDIEDCKPGDALFEIYHLYPLTEHDGGTELVGRLKHGELKPGQSVSYCKRDGSRVFTCEIESIEQKYHKLKKASACCFGLLGPLYSIMIRQFSANAFSRGDYLVVRQEEGAECSELVQNFEKTRLSYAEEYAVCEKVGEPELSDDTVAELSIQECIYALTYSKECSRLAAGKQKREPWEAKTEKLYQALLDKIKNADAIYTTFNKATGFPFLNNGYVEIYSKREYAEIAVQYYNKETFRELEVQEMRVMPLELPKQGGNIKPDFRAPAFPMFYFLGMEQILIDNGFYRAVLSRGDILPPPDFSAIPTEQIPVNNPQLRFRMLDFFEEARWKVQYEKHIENVQQKEALMLETLTESRFLMPVWRKKPAGAEQPEERQMMFAIIKNQAGESFIPLFTDYVELNKSYKPSEWGAAVIDIGKAMALNYQDGIVINPSGENLVLKEKALDAVRTIIENAQSKTESSDEESAEPIGEA